MPLLTGVRLGAYEVISLLGSGGMGDVYRARDTKLGRDVAIKVLPDLFAEDPERVARFEREAQVLAALNHPHIAQIYGFEHAGAVRALVLELVEGLTLADRLRRGPLSPAEALPVASQIAEALEAAHEQGIIHRDLKPANIKVRKDGTVKVLDFGLAKALSAALPDVEPENSPTVTNVATRAGMVLGTAAYMAPEQARGMVVDRRADVWAFGAVFYEMLTGRRAFQRATSTDTLAAILSEEPDWAALPARTPHDITRLIARCLSKDLRNRLQAIGDARIAIDEHLSGAGRAAAFEVPPVNRWKWVTAMLVAVAVTAVATAAIVRDRKSIPGASATRVFALAVPELKIGSAEPPAISPDGNRIVYVAGTALWIQDLNQLTPRVLVPGAYAEHPFWSPEGRHVAYLADSKLWVVPASGGESKAVAAADFQRGTVTPGGVWTEEGQIIYAPAMNRSGLIAVSAAGGDFREYLGLDYQVETDAHKPSALPGKRGILFVLDRANAGPDTICALSGRTRKNILQLAGETLDSPVYSLTGHILYHRTTTNPGVWAVPFSLERLETTGEPFLVAANGLWPSVSSDGTLLFARGTQARLELALYDRSGQMQRALGEPGGLVMTPRFSPDGTRVVFFSDFNLWTLDLRRDIRTRLTFDKNLNMYPIWSPAGDRIIHITRHGAAGPQIVSRPADGSGGTHVLVPDGGTPEISSDSQWLLFSAVVPERHQDLFYVDLKRRGQPRLLVGAPGNQLRPTLSPDGRYFAYESSEGGRSDIYVASFPEARNKIKVSRNGGRMPRWSRRGARLYYMWANELMEVDASTADGVNLGTPRRLFGGTPVQLEQFYDVSPDGTTIVAPREARGSKDPGQALVVMLNWFNEFRQQAHKPR